MIRVDRHGNPTDHLTLEERLYDKSLLIRHAIAVTIFFLLALFFDSVDMTIFLWYALGALIGWPFWWVVFGMPRYVDEPVDNEDSPQWETYR